MNIKQRYIPWTEWEDYKAGMWRKLTKEEEPEYLERAIQFTGDWERYGQAMWEVANLWPRTIINSLTNKSINRRAFLGHCAACLKIDSPEYITRMAWKELTNEQRFNADMEAEKYIKQWMHQYARQNRAVHQGVGNQMLLWGHP